MGTPAPQNRDSRKSVIAENLWLPVQVIALVAILFSTVLAGSRSPAAKSETDTDTVAAPFKHVSVALPPRSSITSRVVVLPLPEAGPRSGLSLEIETRQLRFERNAVSEVRAPASKRREWHLSKIRRKLGEGWELIPLVENDLRQPLGSVFVELDDGWNDFEVVFRDAQGREVSYPVRINHLKMNTPS